MSTVAFTRTTIAVLILSVVWLFMLGDVLSDTLIYARALVSFPSSPANYNFSAYGKLLTAYNHNGLIDYRGLAKSPLLNEAVSQLEHIKPDAFPNRTDKLVFWINAYNLLTIKQIIDCYPLSTAKDLELAKHGRFIVGGRVMTRQELLQDCLRPLAKSEDFRSVFLICSGAIGGPPLFNRVFQGERLHQDAAEMLTWLANQPGNTNLNKVDKIWFISRIFKAAIPVLPTAIADPFALVNDCLPADKQVPQKVAGYRYLYLPEFNWTLNELTAASSTQNKPATKPAPPEVKK